MCLSILVYFIVTKGNLNCNLEIILKGANHAQKSIHRQKSSNAETKRKQQR